MSFGLGLGLDEGVDVPWGAGFTRVGGGVHGVVNGFVVVVV